MPVAIEKSKSIVNGKSFSGQHVDRTQCHFPTVRLIKQSVFFFLISSDRRLPPRENKFAVQMRPVMSKTALCSIMIKQHTFSGLQKTAFLLRRSNLGRFHQRPDVAAAKIKPIVVKLIAEMHPRPRRDKRCITLAAAAESKFSPQTIRFHIIDFFDDYIFKFIIFADKLDSFAGDIFADNFVKAFKTFGIAGVAFEEIMIFHALHGKFAGALVFDRQQAAVIGRKTVFGNAA